MNPFLENPASRRSESVLQVCVCTSYSASAEPRAPRHALAIAALNSAYQVTFVECLPFGVPEDPYDPFADVPNIRRVVHRFASRTARPDRLAVDKIARAAARIQYKLFGSLRAEALDTRLRGFDRTLHRVGANVYFGHNVETLLPVCRVARRLSALAMFDCMEFYSDMGDSQGHLDRKIVHAMEALFLPKCDLVLASSDEMADLLATEYGIQRPVALYNTPHYETQTHSCSHDGLALYWRNSVIGFGQRGLQDALLALKLVPQDVVLHLQGRLPYDGGEEVNERIAALGLSDRVVIHEPYQPPNAVSEAARYCVGLCLGHGGVRNHEVTVSNKIFDYLMAGLVVIASDLPGLRGVVERSQGGLVFQPGNVSDLASKITLLRNDRSLREQLSLSARKFAIRAGNREREMKRFQVAFNSCLASTRSPDAFDPAPSIS